MASASQESNSGSSSTTLSTDERGDSGDELREVCSGLAQSDVVSDPVGVSIRLLQLEPEEGEELAEVSSTVVAHLGADAGIGRSDGSPIFLALHGLEVSFFSLERT